MPLSEATNVSAFVKFLQSKSPTFCESLFLNSGDVLLFLVPGLLLVSDICGPRCSQPQQADLVFTATQRVKISREMFL